LKQLNSSVCYKLKHADFFFSGRIENKAQLFLSSDAVVMIKKDSRLAEGCLPPGSTNKLKSRSSLSSLKMVPAQPRA